jgi:hemerythrin superfamily protein
VQNEVTKMDILSLLEKDHAKVSELFERIEAAEAVPVKESIYGEVRFELLTHTHAEEDVLYQHMRHIDELKQFEKRSEEEHREVREGLKKLDELAVDSPEWKAELRTLKGNVEQHVGVEESDLFPRLRTLISQDTLDQWGDELEQEKHAPRIAA